MELYKHFLCWYLWVFVMSTLTYGSGIVIQTLVNVQLPIYNWNWTDQFSEFQLFKCQFKSQKLWKIHKDEKLDYLLAILSKDRYAAIDHGVPATAQNKTKHNKFLDCIECTLDNEISPLFCIYKQEGIKKKADETIEEVMDCMCQLIHHVQIGDQWNAAFVFEVQCRLIHAIPNDNIELCREHL